MIISHKYRYVFVQLEKTASTAIAKELCEFYSGQEILWKHARYEDFLAVATKEEKQYFAFAGIRNPLDVIVSIYHLRSAGRGNNFNKNNFRQGVFLKNNNYNFYKYFLKFYGKNIYEDWKIKKYDKLNYVYRYENLQEDFSDILKKLGAKQVRPLPVVNKTLGKVNFKSYYMDRRVQLRARIILSSFFSKWGYTFPEGWSKSGSIEFFILNFIFYIKFYFKKAFHLIIDQPLIYRKFIMRGKINVS